MTILGLRSLLTFTRRVIEVERNVGPPRSRLSAEWRRGGPTLIEGVASKLASVQWCRLGEGKVMAQIWGWLDR